MIEHDPEFLAVARAILEGKAPPPFKDKKKGGDADGEEKASEVLDRVKKDVGASDDGGPKADKDPDQSDDPDKDPDQGGGDKKPGFKKKPAKLDKSKDPFKEDGKPAPKKGDAGPDSKGSPKDPGTSPVKDDDPQKVAGAEEKDSDPSNPDPHDDSDNTADGAGSPANKEGDSKFGQSKDGDEGDAEAEESGDSKDGESEGEVIDGSSKSEINVNPKIHDFEPDANEPAPEPQTGGKLEDADKEDDDGGDQKPGDEPKPSKEGDGGKKKKKERVVKESLRDRAMSRALALVEKHIGFKKLEGELSHEKGVRDPGALAAAIGRKKYGKKRFQKMATEEDSADFDSVGHHSKLFRYHDQQARRIQRHLDSGQNWNRDPDFVGESEKGMKARHAYHVRRSVHHASALSTERD